MGTLLSPQSIPVPDGDKGDITVSGGGTAFTIDPATVTTAKLVDANVSSAKLGVDVTAAGKSLLTGASAAAQRTSLGLAAIAASGSGADLAAASVPFTAIANVAAVSFLGNSGGSSAAPAAISEATARAMLGGCFLGIQTFVANGTTPYIPAPGTTRIDYEMTACGGGGGGVNANGGAAGGNSGFYCRGTLVNPAGIAAGSITGSSTGGAGGANTGANGSTGADAVFVVDGKTITMKGGTGGTGVSNSSSVNFGIPLAPQAGSTPIGTNGVYVLRYGPGEPGDSTSSTGISAGGEGGDSPLGSAGSPQGPSFGTGNAGTFGAGGGGAGPQSFSSAGGAGGGFMLIVREWS